MASVERDKQDPFYLSHGAKRPTSAEIVTEARRSLRILGTQRPFTPRDEQRQLFGDASARTRDRRPPSSFSLHARNFEASDSRPSSGTRLSPLEHKPKLPLSKDEDYNESGTAVPKPPIAPLDRKGLAGARTRQLRPRSLTRLPPMTQQSKELHTEDCHEQPKLSLETVQRTNTNNLQHCNARRDRTEAPPELSTKHSGMQQPSRATPQKKETDTEADSGHGDMTGRDATDESVFWNFEVLPVLQEFEAVMPGGSVSEETIEQLCDACTALHCVLAERGKLGRRLKKRSTLLRALFRLIDLGSDQLNLALGKLILALNVSGNNLLNICKLIFKISRSSSNDVLFQKNSIIDSLLPLLQCEDLYSNGEAVLYTVGSLKLLSGNCALSRLLLAKDFISVLLQLAQKLLRLTDPDALPDHNPTVAGRDQNPIAGHILVQLTAALRNMADLSESRPMFTSNDVFSTLCKIMDLYQDDQDVCLNVARILSKLSSYAGCCYALSETLCCYRLFLDLLSKHSRKQNLVVRLLFTLGNLAARSSEARERVYEEEGAADILIGLFQHYHRAAFLASKNPQHEEEDVLVKLIRVLANLSIHPTVGRALAANALCVQLLLEVMEVRSVEESTELVVNASATINNLSYYQEEGTVVRAQHTHISKLLLRLLLSSNMDVVLEATRVFGNLSQIKYVRHFIIENKVHQFIVTLLDSKNPDVCFSACGVLMNLSVDPEYRTILRKEGAIQKLMDCLRDFGPKDWQLAGLVCQTLWNCMEDGETQNMQELLEILSLYSDQTFLQWPSCDDVKEYQNSCWEQDFLPVAQKLKKRIQSNMNLMEPISEPS
ncbi:armadillo repeat-containing protein 2 [Astyanax mexicanus]|uniref:Armadillo repeat containing 2 n=1 Tax=Astyanax mexicanus TaxID=7994 RepID=W5L5Q4_ASTMX|nr:armadillo repeat-containing protein 2 [Astyanax mexicanus]XP_049335891.1 armadillo repeat-containing protein 2 [Astyanax mexicanus]